MGILNVTPDSFSDGGQWLDPAAAVQHGQDLWAAGADLVDVGGESTRPGAQRVSAAEELRRVLPVVSELAQRGIPVSIDSTRAEVARAAIVAGAQLINDVSGGLAEPEMLRVAAELEVPIVLMHWRGPATVMAQHAHYDQVVAEVCAQLQSRVQAAVAAGVPAERIILDPGLGFAKESAHNWQLLAGLTQLLDLGFPLLIGAARKRFLRALAPAAMAGTTQWDELTAAVTAVVAQAGAWGVRVHEVPSNIAAVQVAAALRQVRP